MNEKEKIMIQIHTDTFIPYELSVIETYNYIIQRCLSVKGSLKFLEMTNEHLYVRCPFAGDYLELVGPMEELMWVHERLVRNKWYRIK